MLLRNITSSAKDLLNNFPVLVIIGPRQAGKTTLAKCLAPDYAFFDLEKPSHYDQIATDPEFFFAQHPHAVILDEAQELPILFNILRSVIDENRHQYGRFIVTGSSSMELLSSVSETLAGRAAIIELGTLKANEYWQKPLSPFYDLFKGPLTKESLILGTTPPLSLKQIQHCWLRGGYPEPTLRWKNEQHYYAIWMTNYQSTYLNRDIARLFPKLNRTNYRRFLAMLSKLSGSILNKSDLARALEVSEPTISHYLDIAHGTFIWRQLPSFENNVTKSIVKMPKGYIRDSGLLHQLLHINTLENLYGDVIVGRSFESFVIEEILNGLQDCNIANTQYYYYRTRGGAEIDLILTGNFGVLPIEIKLGNTVMRKKLMALEKFIEEHHTPFGIVINQSEEIKWLTPNIIQIPVGWV